MTNTIGYFLLHETDVGDIVWIKMAGYNAQLVYIDSEDLFYKYLDKGLVETKLECCEIQEITNEYGMKMTEINIVRW